MKIRLMGTPDEIAQALTEFQATRLTITEQSRPYPCRGTSGLVRVYLDTRLTTEETR